MVVSKMLDKKVNNNQLEWYSHYLTVSDVWDLLKSTPEAKVTASLKKFWSKGLRWSSQFDEATTHIQSHYVLRDNIVIALGTNEGARQTMVSIPSIIVAPTSRHMNNRMG
jgi:hypothetical protein